MEALGLCENIYGFMSQPSQGPGQETQLERPPSAIPEPHLPTASEPANLPEVASASGASATTANLTKSRQATVTDDDAAAQSADAGKGLLLGLVGKKVDAYNLRGVEAGMDLLVMGGAARAGRKYAGKVLHAQQRRQQRMQKSPYERKSVGAGGKGESASGVDGTGGSSCDKYSNTS